MSEPRAVAEADLDALVVQVEGLDLEENKIGSGAYGIVYEVTVAGEKCIAKKLHNILIQAIKHYPRGQDDSIVRKFKNECCILSKLEHPNVVRFKGVHYGRDENDISLIMERLNCDLSVFVKKNPDTPLCDRLHILYDVSKGLEYLHSRSPPLIHRDLTAPNILLTEDLTAKIGDLGVSRYVDPTVVTKLTTNPGTSQYMAPETQDPNPHYTTKLDIFSFGHLIIHTIIGDFPGVYRVQTGTGLLQLVKTFWYQRGGKVELMRRDDAVHKQMGSNHCLYPLMVRCLHDSSEQRPSVGKVKISLRKLCLKQYPEMTLLEACKTGKVEVVKLLLEDGADPNQADEVNMTAMSWASSNGHNEVLRVLIQAGANVNTQDKWGQSPLWNASFEGHTKCVELLVNGGAYVDVPKEDGFTALMVAAQNGHLKVVEMLIASKANVNHQNNSGESPLWSASFYDRQKCVLLLIEAGANVDVPKEDGYTALMAAAQNGHLKIVEMLIASKANINHQNNSNMTALMCAAKKGHSSIVELLLSKGADPNLSNNDGKNVYDLAYQNGRTQICRQLYIMITKGHI